MKGELWAMMLDAKRTFDDLIERHAPDEKTRDRILYNRIYQEVSNAMAGSQEYMAMEKLYELYQEDRYDLLVLDTPPTRNALDFIDAPERMTRFIEGTLPAVLPPAGPPRHQGARPLRRRAVLGAEAHHGIDLLQDLSEFFQSFGDMAQGFSERAQRVNELLGHREHDVRAGDRAGARADRRGGLLLAPADARRSCRSAAWWSTRCTTTTCSWAERRVRADERTGRSSARRRARALARRSGRGRRPRRKGVRELRELPRAGRSATARTSPS